MDAVWSYSEAFIRNLGLIGPEEQARLRRARVAIVGMGGVGGVHLVTLARLGIGCFTIADPDIFELANINRQTGATCRTIGQPKVDVMAEWVRTINPEVKLRVLREPITIDNVDEFLREADLFIDGIDFFSIDLRRVLFRKAANLGIYGITAGPIGFSTAWLVFSPNGMSFDRYFDLHDEMTRHESLVAFAVGLTPAATQMRYMDLRQVDLDRRTGPSTIAACQLCAGVAAVEAFKILTGRGVVRPAPCYFQFDPYRLVFRQGRLWCGNRHPWQRLKRWWLARRFT
jgi:molybdopterin/thiamine biosynthesis adenylyltransferase